MGHRIDNSRAQLRHSRGTAGAQLGQKVTWGTVEAKSVETQLRHSWGTVGAQLGHNLRTDERKISLGTVGHTFLLGTVGAGLRLRLL